MIRYKIVSRVNGKLWKSGAIGARDERHVIQEVQGGWFVGTPRWAIDADTGAFIYGLDERGVPMTGPWQKKAPAKKTPAPPKEPRAPRAKKMSSAEVAVLVRDAGIERQRKADDDRASAEREAIHLTHYEGFGYVEESPTSWRFLDLTDGISSPRPVGQSYRSRGALLKALDAYAIDYGFTPNSRVGAEAPAKPKSVVIRYGRVCKA